ncbi:MAG: cobalamin biosynthesis protein CobQ [Candidatus Levybacteria bacterium]|nr:cobalamin biosynthesis protein CobQ [Candidatus Levybacteria bacterium]
MKLIIGWLYPDLMSTYGDRGNIIVLQKRCEWRGIETEVLRLDLEFTINYLRKCDLLFMGGAQDRQQKIVSNDLSKDKVKALKNMIDDEIPGLYICGAYQFLGKYYKEADGTTIPGLDILDLYTENPGINKPRLIGNIVTKIYDLRFKIYDHKNEENIHKSYFINHKSTTLVGFENHGGRTYLGKDLKPFGEVMTGFGNNGTDGTEGAVYKNSYGTYLHGPILPKNPRFADLLIKLSLEKKYKKEIKLKELDDSLEEKARDIVMKRYLR